MGLGSLALATMSSSLHSATRLPTLHSGGRSGGSRSSGGRGSGGRPSGGAGADVVPSPGAGANTAASAGTAVLGSAGEASQGQLLPELWRLRWLGPLEDEQVEVGPLLVRWPVPAGCGYSRGAGPSRHLGMCCGGCSGWGRWSIAVWRPSRCWCAVHARLFVDSGLRSVGLPWHVCRSAWYRI